MTGDTSRRIEHDAHRSLLWISAGSAALLTVFFKDIYLDDPEMGEFVCAALVSMLAATLGALALFRIRRHATRLEEAGDPLWHVWAKRSWRLWYLLLALLAAGYGMVLYGMVYVSTHSTSTCSAETRI